ncbi:hypothetical protein AnigIFM63604_010831 [Aspergillus niger]|uniref:Uncharacterized protein n=1 Tax=Aspergillus niger TaxID=5061 RepID=A0A9W6A9Y5_ASPNG|nr:hypothetical protein AnigIFM63604_010831 [Aspergillus niger]
MANEVTPSNLLKAMARPASTTVSTFVAAQTLAIDETKDIGDFVSTEDEELEIEVTAEPWGKYDPTELREVFYPIHLGEILNERDLSTNSVLVVLLLPGWPITSRGKKKDVAVKVLSAGDSVDIELRIQNEIVRSVQDRSHLVTYLDTFLLKGNPLSA